MTRAQQRVYPAAHGRRGEFLGAAALSEPDAGSDLGEHLLPGRKRVGDDWVITGNKYWCTFADGADFIIVFARTDRDAPIRRRRHAASRPSWSRSRAANCRRASPGAPIPKIGYFGWKTWELAFDKCRVPAQNMIGEEGQRLLLATAGLETARAHTAARSIGLAQAGARGRRPPRQGAPAVRPADRRVPGYPLQDREHGDRDRGRTPADVLRLRQDRPRRRAATRKPRW